MAIEQEAVDRRQRGPSSVGSAEANEAKAHAETLASLTRIRFRLDASEDEIGQVAKGGREAIRRRAEREVLDEERRTGFHLRLALFCRVC